MKEKKIASYETHAFILLTYLTSSLTFFNCQKIGEVATLNQLKIKDGYLRREYFSKIVIIFEVKDFSVN